MARNEIFKIDTLGSGVYSGLTDAVPYYVYDQQSTINRQLYLMLSFVVEKIEAFFGVNL